MEWTTPTIQISPAQQKWGAAEKLWKYCINNWYIDRLTVTVDAQNTLQHFQGDKCSSLAHVGAHGSVCILAPMTELIVYPVKSYAMCVCFVRVTFFHRDIPRGQSSDIFRPGKSGISPGTSFLGKSPGPKKLYRVSRTFRGTISRKFCPGKSPGQFPQAASQASRPLGC